MTFDPNTHITKIQGRDYLEVKYRIQWFRDDHKDGSIMTEVLPTEQLMVRASILVDGKVLATGHGSANTDKKTVWTGRELEKAETAAIGRALAHAGYGTQFTAESEGDNLADSPVERNNGNGKKTYQLPKDDRPWSVAQKQALIDAKLAKNDFAARGMLGLSVLPIEATPKEIVRWGEVYRTYREENDAKTAAMMTNDEVMGKAV